MLQEYKVLKIPEAQLELGLNEWAGRGWSLVNFVAGAGMNPATQQQLVFFLCVFTRTKTVSMSDVAKLAN